MLFMSFMVKYYMATDQHRYTQIENCIFQNPINTVLCFLRDLRVLRGENSAYLSSVLTSRSS